MSSAAGITPLKAPFPWFGGKSAVADLVWERFGDVDNYVEPFAGSLAVLLARTTPPRVETVNDLDCYLANFWRAIEAAPAEVARWADAPVNEADLHARHTWLVQRAEFRERMKSEPDYFDAKVAGWWVWGISCWIGGGWCQVREGRVQRRRSNCEANKNGYGIQQVVDRLHPGGVERKRPDIYASKFGRGVHQKMPNVDARGLKGCVANQLPLLDAMCDSKVHNANAGPLEAWFGALQERLRRVRVCCGDWSRVLGPTPLGLTSNVPAGFRTGVFLDPPYAGDVRDAEIYAVDSATVSAEVRAWAIAHGDEPKLRVALCGYEGEHDMPASWDCVPWKAWGGYGNQDGENSNSRRERIWFSPHCLKPGFGQQELFA